MEAALGDLAWSTSAYLPANISARSEQVAMDPGQQHVKANDVLEHARHS